MMAEATSTHMTSVAAGFPWPLTIVEVPADVPFGEALNRGAARASGRFVAKWDDDDWYGPEHLADLVLAADYSGADLVGSAHQLTYLEQINLTVYHPRSDAERSVWACERALIAARIDGSLLRHLLVACVCLVAHEEEETPRTVLERVFRRAVSDREWREEYAPLID